MEFNNDELNLLRQWYEAIEDMNPKYLEEKDKVLYQKIKDVKQV